MASLGMGRETTDKPIPVVIWDAAFPFPNAWNLFDTKGPFYSASSRVIIVPSFHQGVHRTDRVEYFCGVGIHEGFHALIFDWAKNREITARDALRFWSKLDEPAARWRKFEESCAVFLETTINGGTSYLDYGRDHQSAFSLSHRTIQSNNAHARTSSGGLTPSLETEEEYAHFAFLEFVNERWPNLNIHWLRLVWAEVFSLKEPFMLLQESLFDAAVAEGVGGARLADSPVARLFLAYVEEAAFAAAPIGALARLRQEFGKPAAFMLQQGCLPALGVVHAMSAQFFKFHGKGSSLRIETSGGATPGASPADTFIRVARIGEQGGNFDIEIPESSLIEGTSDAHWEIPIPDDMEKEYLAMLCRPHFDKRGIGYSVRWL